MDDEAVRFKVKNTHNLPRPSPNLIHITHDTALKAVDRQKTCCADPASESEALRLISSQTTIRSPVFRRIIPDLLYDWVAMELVLGIQLVTCWSTLPMWTKLRVAWTIRRYVRQLRAIADERSTIPGPLGPGPQPCHSRLFPGDKKPSFKDRETFAKYWRMQAKPFGLTEPCPVDFSAPLVFCHNDLSMRNIMIDINGDVWLVDWGWAGFFPPWFEYINMAQAAEYDKAPWSWKVLIPLMTGPYFVTEDWLEKVGMRVVMPCN